MFVKGGADRERDSLPVVPEIISTDQQSQALFIKGDIRKKIMFCYNPWQNMFKKTFVFFEWLYYLQFAFVQFRLKRKMF